jgi:hypothetical protein
MKKVFFYTSLLIMRFIFADEPSNPSDLMVEVQPAPTEKPQPVTGPRSPAQLVGIKKREEPHFPPMPPLVFPENVGNEEVITVFGSMPPVPAKHPEIPQNVKPTIIPYSAPKAIPYVRKAPRIALPSKAPEEIKNQEVVSVG